MAETADETYYSTSEIARRYPLSERSARRYVETGVLPAIQFVPRGKYRIPASAIEALVGAPLDDERQSGPRPEGPPVVSVPPSGRGALAPTRKEH
jgi:excisionase family DNA binding protein